MAKAKTWYVVKVDGWEVAKVKTRELAYQVKLMLRGIYGDCEILVL